MEKNEELLETLNNLRALSKNKKFRLAKPEHDETVKTLSAVCLIGAEGVKAVLEALPDFPSDSGSEIVAANWDVISAHLNEFYKALQGTRYKTELGKRLRLLIGKHLSTQAPEVAMRVIFDVYRDMTPAKKAFPTAKDLNLISSTLLADGASVLNRLPLDLGMKSQSVQMVSFCLGAGFSLGTKGKPLTNMQTQFALIRWANKQSKYLDPEKGIQELIAARIHGWNDDFLKLLRSELDALHPSLKNPINGVLKKSIAREPQVASEDHAASVSNHEVEQIGRPPADSALLQTVTGQDMKDTYDALYELGLLTNYIEQTKLALSSSQGDVYRLERELHQAKIELEVARREKEGAKGRCSIVEGKLAGSLIDCSRLKHSVKNQQDQIESLKSQLVDADKRYKNALESHRADVTELSTQIAKEGDHCLATFRNKLAGMLRPIAINLKEARSMEMTPELGTAMRTQLNQILNMMKSQGIALEGDDA